MRNTKEAAIVKRRKTVRRQKRLLLSTFLCLMIVVIFLCFSFIANADSTDKIHAYKYYTDITVREGETLWDIAQDYMSKEYDSPKAYIKEVKDINSLLDADQIYSGQRLVVPYYSTELKN